MLMGTWPSMRYEYTIWPVGERMKTVTAWLFFLANSTQACVIFSAVSTEISFLIRVFFAASSEMTNLLMFWAVALIVHSASIVAAKPICLMFFSLLRGHFFIFGEVEAGFFGDCGVVEAMAAAL